MSDLTPSSHHTESHPRRSRLKTALKCAGIIVVGLILLWLGTMKRTIGINNGNPLSNFWRNVTLPELTPDPSYAMPKKEENRLDVLILGIRGQDDPDAKDGGPLLTDSIEILSYDKSTGRASLVSLPRDLQVLVHDQHMDKLNTVYEYGYYHSSDHLGFMKTKISQITGVYIDKVVVLNFSAFKEIVDSLGGVDVTLAKPFSESQQWGYKFSLPAGVNHLDGQQALYYARSRYSSSDFDRSQRQQQIILAMKDKLLALNFLSEPVKTFNIFNAVRKDITTDIGVFDINQFLGLAKAIDFAKIKKYVISTDNLVHEARDEKGSYILVPNLEKFEGIKKQFQDILTI